MTRHRYLVLGVIVAVGCQSQTSPTSPPSVKVEAPPPSPDPGQAVWAEGYPRQVPTPNAAPGAVEVFGAYEVRPGWVLTAAQCETVPVGGGVRSGPIAIEFADGKWGATDPKDKTKIIPARVSLGKGKWKVRVGFLFEGKDASGVPLTVPYQTATKTVEVE